MWPECPDCIFTVHSFHPERYYYLFYGAHVEGALLGHKMLLCPGFTLEVLQETLMVRETI